MSREVTPVTEYQSNSIAGWKFNVDAMFEELKVQYELTESISDENQKKERIDHLNTAKKALSRIRDGKILSWRTNGCRVFNPIVLLARSMRKHITGNRGRLVEIDCANSHPLLLAHKFINQGTEIEQDLLDRLSTNRFYELFSDNRDEAKRMCFSFFYSKIRVNPQHPAYRILKKYFPIFTQAIVDASENGSLSEHMQIHESSIWIDKVSTACMYARINHCTAHDGVVFEYTGNEEINKVETIVRAAFGEIKPYLHLKFLGEEEGPANEFRDVPEMHQFIEMIRMQLGERDLNPDVIITLSQVSKYYFTIGFLSFWTPVSDKDPGFGILDADVIEFLKKKGYAIIPTEKQPQYVRIVKNIIEKVTDPDIRKQMSSFIQGLADTVFGISKKTILNAFHARTGKGLSLNAHYAYLPDITGQLIKTKPDTPNQSFIPFRNGVVSIIYDIDSEEISRTLIPYHSINHWVWKDTIRKVDYSLDQDASDKSDIAHYLYRISGQKLSEIQDTPDELERMEKKVSDLYNMMRAVGYMLHQHKNPAQARGIVIIDANLGNYARGGAGKSLLVLCMGVIRQTVLVDGQESEKKWLMDGVEHSTEIVSIEDMHRKFPLGMLNNMITGNMLVNHKMGKKVVLPFEISPKIIANSNFMIDYTIPGAKRRWIVIEINDHYSETHSPADELGHRLIDDWNSDQLNIELNFLMECIEAYLKDGLPEELVTDVSSKLLHTTIGEDYAEAFTELISGWRNAPEPRYRSIELMRDVYQLLGWSFEGLNITDEITKKFNAALKKFLEVTKVPYKHSTIRRTRNNSPERFRGFQFEPETININ